MLFKSSCWEKDAREEVAGASTAGVQGGWVGREGRDAITSQDFTHKGDSFCVGLHQADKKVRLDFKARELRRSSSAL